MNCCFNKWKGKPGKIKKLKLVLKHKQIKFKLVRQMSAFQFWAKKLELKETFLCRLMKCFESSLDSDENLSLNIQKLLCSMQTDLLIINSNKIRVYDY